jgi:hypothetical protein
VVKLAYVRFQVLTAAANMKMKVIIALMMEAASASETSVNFYQTTQRNIPEDCYLHCLNYVDLVSDSYNFTHPLCRNLVTCGL